MERIRVVGCSGSGKTTTAAAMAARLGVPHLELDAVHWMPGWSPRDADDFRRLVAEFASRPAWVIDRNYSARTEGLLDDRTDTFVWLDLPRWRVVSAVLHRTIRRSVRGEELWDTGNRERLSSLLSTDPMENLLLWAWTSHDRLARRYGEAQRVGPHQWVRLRTRRDVRRFLEGLRPVTPEGADG